MKLIWTKSGQPLSAVIRAVTGDDCSHFAFVFESAAKGLMFESNLLGTHPKFFANAKKHMEIVHEIDLDLSIEIEDKLWDIIVQRYDDKAYDFGGILYLGWRILLKRFFGLAIPAKNKWASDNAFFCDEIYAALQEIGFEDIGITCGMDTPHDVYQKLKGLK